MGKKIYTVEELAAIASQYHELPLFRKEQPKAYDAIGERGLRDELCGHMKRGRPKTWTVDELAAIASQYHDLPLFRKEQPKAYDAIGTRGLRDELCGHMKRAQAKRYTDEELKAIADQYHDASVFLEEQHKAYDAIFKRGLLDELCGHMKKKRKDVYTEDELAAVAKDYNDLTVFKRERQRIYSAIQRKGLLDKLCGHMKRNMRPDYTDDELAALAKDYDDLTVFRKAHRQPYFAIVRRGKVDELCGHMKRNKPETYTEEEIRNISLEYQTRDEFHKKDGGAYLAAHRRGILDDVCSHMEELRRPKGFYSKGYCHVVALDYQTREDFRRGNGYAYQLAFKEGWLDDICGHMKAVGNLKKRLIYVYTFADGYAYVGLTDDVKRRKYEHLHKIEKKGISPVYQHYRKTGANYEYKELTDWLDADTAARMEDDYIKQYKADGWKMLNSVKGGALGRTTGNNLTAKKIRAIVSRYEYVEDFRDGEPKVYGHLCSRQEFSKYCSGLKRRKKPMGYWDLEKALAVIPECETREIFNKRYCQAYRIVKAAGLLTKYYPEKVKPKCKWTLEACANAARYCETKADFRRKYHRAYERLRKMGLLDEMFEDTQRREYQRTYTNEERVEILKRCESRTELRGMYAGVYKWARGNGLIDKYLPKKKQEGE